MSSNLTSRSIKSVKWNSISNIVQISFSIIQTIVLARLLPIAAFGVYAGALAITQITGSLASFGMHSAFLYRSKYTEDIEKTAAIHFTLQLVISIIWTGLMLFGGLLLIKPTADGFLTVFMIITISQTILNISNTPRLIIARRVEYKRIATITIVDTILTFILSIFLAVIGKPLLALAITNIVNAFTHLILLYFWKPIFKPKFAWDSKIVKFFLSFGSRQVIAGLLLNALDRFDELWIKIYLGNNPLGYYSKAFSFAQYPSKIVAAPISNVSNATYAEIAGDRKKLSEAFLRTNSLLIYSGFFIVGSFLLAAPEFIRIVLGERWMPMLLALQIMLPYAMFEPIKQTMSNIFLSVGKPETIVRIRTIQLVIMIIGLFIFGTRFGIEGVAIAADITILVGISLVLILLRKHVDYSLKKLFATPVVAFMLGFFISFGIDRLFLETINDLPSALVKISIFSGIFIAIGFLFDKKEFVTIYRLIQKYVFNM